MGKERRKEKRVSEENKISFKIISKEKTQKSIESFFALTKNISVGGASILTDNFLTINTLLKIDLLLAKKHKHICVVGKIKWINELYENELYEIGIEFIDSLPDDILLLLEYVYRENQS